VQFKSLSGKGCLVNIYDRGYSGGFADLSKTGNDVPFAVEQGVTALQGASDCFYYDEDDEKDFLQFLRVKTGFLRLVEETYGALDNLQPSQPMEHYVEVFYGVNLVFTGYMQCSEYSSSFVACPRVLEYVITSPLGFLDSFNFSANDVANPTMTLGAALQEVLAGLDAKYNKVVWPGATVAPWNSLVPTSVLVPFNKAYKHTDADSDLYEPRDFRFFLEGICSYFGWVLHDSPTTLFFAKYDHPILPDGQYSSIALEDIGSPQESDRTDITQSNPYSLLANYSNADGSATMSVVRPLKQLEVTMGGESNDDLSLTTRNCKVRTSRWYSGNAGVGYSLEQVGNEVDGYNIGVASWNGPGIPAPGLYPIQFTTFAASDRTLSYKEFWVAVIDNSNATLLKKLISWKHNGCFDVSENTEHGHILGIRIQIGRGTTLSNLSTNWSSDTQLMMSIRSGGKYYNFGSGQWQSTEAATTVTFDRNSGHIVGNLSLPDYPDCDGYIAFLGDGVAYDFEVSLYYRSINGMSTGNYISIEKMELFDPLRGLAAYGKSSHNNDGRTFVIKGSNKGVEEGSVDVGMNSSFLYKGNTTFVNADGTITGYEPDYPYVFKPSAWLTQKFKGGQMTNEYVYRYNYFTQGWVWKVMAHGFDLCSDTHTLTLARSELLNNQAQ
jgi:hypothetical protein